MVKTSLLFALIFFVANAAGVLQSQYIGDSVFFSLAIAIAASTVCALLASWRDRVLLAEVA